MFRVFILILFTPLLAWAAPQKIACSHPQVCNLINHIQPDAKAMIPEIMNGDPHLYSPSPSSIKKYLDADVLVAAPLELNPWIRHIVELRKKVNKPTYVLKLLDLKNIQTSKESKAHFWLNIDALCDSRNQIITFFKWANSKCPFLESNLIIKRELAPFKQTPFILAHDALSTLVQLNNLISLPIQSGGHDHEVDSKSMKKLVSYIKTYERVIWVEEPPIHFPKSILQYKRANDILIKVNVDGELGQEPTKVLTELIAKLIETQK